jgi:hypothetical protein
MALNSGLFQSDEQDAQDLQTSRGWTIDDQRPGMFDNSLLAIPRALGQAGANIVGAGAKALESPDDLFSFIGNPLGQAATAVHNFQHPKPSPTTGVLPDVEKASREYAASLVPDPRVTGTGANLIQGFGRAAAEFTAGTLAGGPGLGAAAIGLSEGHAKYNDLLAEGVDDATASRAASVEALSQGAGALMPFGLPAKWLAGMSGAGAFLTQTLAGAGLNTALNASSRYASAQILDQAGYHEMAEKQKPFDTMNILADAALGAAFGAHHAWGELGEHVDPSVVDAAKTVQDGQAVAERAPGVPVDLRAEAVNRQALEKSLSDLMAGKPVDLTGVDIDGAEFARRPDLETPEARAIMADEFKNSGVLDDAEALDRWLSGETDEKPIGVRGAAEADVSPMEGSEELHPDAENLNAAARSFADDGTVVSAQIPQAAPPREAEVDRYLASAPLEAPLTNVSEATASRLKDPAIAEELKWMAEHTGWDTVGGRMIRVEGPDGGRGNISTISRTPWIPREPFFADMAHKLGKSDRSYTQVIKDALEGKKLKAKERRTVEEMAKMAEERVHGSRDEDALADEQHAATMDAEAHGLETDEAHAEYERHLQDVANSSEAELDAIARRETEGPGNAAEAQSEPGKAVAGAGSEGGETGAAETPGTQGTSAVVGQALAERPDLSIADEAGKPQSADQAHVDALNEEARADAEADPMFNAAADCESRRGAV